MGDIEKNVNQVDKSAQGAEEPTKLEKEVNPEKIEGSNEVPDNVPAWVPELFAAIGDLTDAIDDLREDLTSRKGQGASNVSEEKTKPEVKVKAKAKYVVAKGKAFKDRLTGKRINEGQEVKMDTERLQNLLSQGIIEEKE